MNLNEAAEYLNVPEEQIIDGLPYTYGSRGEQFRPTVLRHQSPEGVYWYTLVKAQVSQYKVFMDTYGPFKPGVSR